jgi:hypothetical protein
MATEGIKISSQPQITDTNIDENINYTIIRDTGGGSYTNERISQQQMVDFSSLNQNDFINGNLDIWQDGNSFTSIVNDTYFADEMAYIKNGAGIHNITRDSTTPNDNYNYSAKLTVTTGDLVISATDYYAIETRLEGYNIIKYVDGKLTFGFWFRSSVTGTYCVSVRNGTPDRSYITEFTVNAANTFEFKTITIPINFTGTLNTTNGIGLRVTIVLAAGSNYHTTAGAWQNGNFLSTSNQVNSVNSTLNTIYWAGLSINKGTIVRPNFDYNYQQELAKCQRHFIKLNLGGVTLPIGIVYGVGAAANNRGFINLPTTLRVLPAISFTGTINSIGQGAVITTSTLVAQDLRENGVGIYVTTTGVALTNLETYFISGANATISFNSRL